VKQRALRTTPVIAKPSRAPGSFIGIMGLSRVIIVLMPMRREPVATQASAFAVRQRRFGVRGALRLGPDVPGNEKVDEESMPSDEAGMQRPARAIQRIFLRARELIMKESPYKSRNLRGVSILHS
jgi:hypothetical protein